SISEFLSDVALITDLDTNTDTEHKVALLTIHLAKGLEFPYVYIVGMEENLFPNAMSVQSREELEEERRLFYVALTRAEKKATLSFAKNRYRWGKLIDAEPSRFIYDIDESFVEFNLPDDDYAFKPLFDTDIFDDVDKSKLRQQKPVNKLKEKQQHHTPDKRKLRKIKPDNAMPSDGKTSYYPNLVIGKTVRHTRFGRGVVKAIEGVGGDQKAEIKFEQGGIKRLILKYAKLEILD
ncbi:MAG: 3'-5' exonuclease, partial [Flavobacteriaceae bacterium]|nr:3'-5' exonuclease [Flavobacteriaceae bacterium]